MKSHVSGIYLRGECFSCLKNVFSFRCAPNDAFIQSIMNEVTMLINMFCSISETLLLKVYLKFHAAYKYGWVVFLTKHDISSFTVLLDVIFHKQSYFKFYNDILLQATLYWYEYTN